MPTGEKTSKNAVSIIDLDFEYNSFSIFKKVNLEIERGKITAIMGPSGSGKTTLLKIISAQLRPSKGKILVEDQDIHQLSQKELYRKRRQMGMLFQSGALFTNLSVFENVAFPLREHTKLPEEMIHDLVLIQLETVGLRGAARLMPSELSGGMARRVALARTLMLNPKLMLYDEPFTGQDPITMGVLLKLIKNINDTLGLTSVIVSHDVAETASIADYIYVVSEGKIIGEGSSKKVFADQSLLVNQFISGKPDGPIPFHYPSNIDFPGDLNL
jgi:phospholipid/cholesterol/gamma-HCH transport system ATP-binding protein